MEDDSTPVIASGSTGRDECGRSRSRVGQGKIDPAPGCSVNCSPVGVKGAIRRGCTSQQPNLSPAGACHLTTIGDKDRVTSCCLSTEAHNGVSVTAANLRTIGNDRALGGSGIISEIGYSIAEVVGPALIDDGRVRRGCVVV